MVSIFKSSPFLLEDVFEITGLPGDCQEDNDMEGSGKDKALSTGGGLIVGECARAVFPKSEAEVALRRGDFAGVGGLTFSVFSEVSVWIL